MQRSAACDHRCSTTWASPARWPAWPARSHRSLWRSTFRRPPARAHRVGPVPRRAGMPAERRQTRPRHDCAAVVCVRRPHCAARDHRRRSGFRHLRASAGQRRDRRLWSAVDGRTRRTRRRTIEHPLSPGFRHRRHGHDPAARVVVSSVRGFQKCAAPGCGCIAPLHRARAAAHALRPYPTSSTK